MKTAIALGALAVLLAMVVAGCDEDAIDLEPDPGHSMSFTNLETPDGEGTLHVNDLHVEWEETVFDVSNTFTPNSGWFPRMLPSVDGRTTHFSGNVIPYGETCVVRYSTLGGSAAYVKRWWWTQDGEVVNMVHEGKPPGN